MCENFVAIYIFELTLVQIKAYIFEFTMVSLQSRILVHSRHITSPRTETVRQSISLSPGLSNALPY